MVEFKSGDKVVHALFGPGVVRTVAGAGLDARIVVDFSSSVGQKKLVAGVAHLQLLNSDSASSNSSAVWFDSFTSTCRPRAGRHHRESELHPRIRAEVRRPDFWIEVRERMRGRGLTPKVVDAPNGRISVSCDGLLTLNIRVQHDSIDDARTAPAGGAIFDSLCARLLVDFEGFTMQKEFGMQFPLIADDIVTVEEPEVGDLPNRSPLRRPKRVMPRGYIRPAMGKRSDF